jgi:hypothetical protein
LRPLDPQNRPATTQSFQNRDYLRSEPSLTEILETEVGLAEELSANWKCHKSATKVRLIEDALQDLTLPQGSNRTTLDPLLCESSVLRKN